MRWLLLGSLIACGPQPQGASAPAVSTQAPRYRGPIIDMHAHLLTAEQQAQTTKDHPPGVAHLRALDERGGVTRSALITIAPQGDLPETRRLNDEVIAAAEASAGRFFAVASVHPGDGKDALDELARLAAAGVRVIKLHPNSQRFDVGAPEVSAVVVRAAELGLALLFDGYSPFDADQTGKFAKLALGNPKARMIIAHIGGPRFHEMAQFGMIRDFSWYAKNLWFDLSAMAHTYADSPYEEQLVWVARLIGTDRILFGSDYPVDTPAHAVDDIVRLGFTVSEQRQILHDNAAELLSVARP